MTVVKATVMLLVWMMLVVGGTSLGSAEEQRSTLLKQYWGTITAVRVDRCGKRPGLCEGAILLSRPAGDEVTLAVRPGTWIKRGERLVLLEDLRVGNEVHVQAVKIVEEGPMRATTVEVSTQP